MHETPDDLERLQEVLDTSLADSGTHIRSAFSQDNRPTATELVDYLPGLFELHLAVIAGDGAPLVAPVDGFLLRGRICLGLPARSVRATLVRRDPRVSASYIGTTASFIVHGSFVEIDDAHPDLDLYKDSARALYVAEYGSWFKSYLTQKWETEGRGAVGVIYPRKFFAKRE